MIASGFLLALGILLTHECIQCSGLGMETLVVADESLSCQTVGDSFVVSFVYTSQEFDLEDFVDRADIDIFINDDLIGSVITGYEEEKFHHDGVSNLFSYKHKDIVSYEYNGIPWNGSSIGYSFRLDINFNKVTLDLDQATVIVTNKEYVDLSSSSGGDDGTSKKKRTSEAEQEVFLNVSVCEVNEPLQSSPPYCEYDCEAFIACEDGSNPVKSKCVSGCKFARFPECGGVGDVNTYSESLTFYLYVTLGGVVILALCMIVLSCIRHKKAGSTTTRRQEARLEVQQVTTQGTTTGNQNSEATTVDKLRMSLQPNSPQSARTSLKPQSPDKARASSKPLATVQESSPQSPRMSLKPQSPDKPRASLKPLATVQESSPQSPSMSLKPQSPDKARASLKPLATVQESSLNRT